MNLGYSHQVVMSEEPKVSPLKFLAPNKIIISRYRTNRKSVSLRLKIREKRPPEPYKGKGIKYADEVYSA